MTRAEAVIILDRALQAERANVDRIRREVAKLQDEALVSWAAVRALDCDWARVSLGRLSDLLVEHGRLGYQVEVIENLEVQADRKGGE